MHTVSIQQLFKIKNNKAAVTVKIILWALLVLCIVITSIVAMSDIMSNCLSYVVDTWNLSEEDCDGDEPMLLSRAITTDATVRGLAIAMSLFGAFLVDTPALNGDDHSRIHNVLKYAFLCFAFAFTVSMFDAGGAHTVLIFIGSIVTLVATFPHGNNNNKVSVCSGCFTMMWWWALWFTTVVSAILWFIGYMETGMAIRSYWYIAEYIFFAFLLETVAFVNLYLELRDYTGRQHRDLDQT